MIFLRLQVYVLIGTLCAALAAQSLPRVEASRSTSRRFSLLPPQDPRPRALTSDWGVCPSRPSGPRTRPSRQRGWDYPGARVREGNEMAWVTWLPMPFRQRGRARWSFRPCQGNRKGDGSLHNTARPSYALHAAAQTAFMPAPAAVKRMHSTAGPFYVFWHRGRARRSFCAQPAGPRSRPRRRWRPSAGSVRAAAGPM